MIETHWQLFDEAHHTARAAFPATQHNYCRVDFLLLVLAWFGII